MNASRSLVKTQLTLALLVSEKSYLTPSQLVVSLREVHTLLFDSVVRTERVPTTVLLLAHSVIVCWTLVAITRSSCG